MKKCKSCGQQVNEGQSHYCSTEGRTIEANDGDFLLSMAVGGAITGSLLGGLVGGDPVGGLLGDILSDGDIDLF
jgi:hypothetical protein